MSAEERAFLRAGVLDGTFLWEWNCPRCRYVPPDELTPASTDINTLDLTS
jgi:hypothetical protein